MTDTIFAPASGAGRAAIAILRLSGPQTAAALDALCGGPPPPRRASLRSLRDSGGEILDRAVVIWFPGPHSFTGEDSAELHLHGAPAVLRAVSRWLAALPGLRPAEPGEFARRAFDHGRMDLTEADGLADLIDAETEAQRRRALAQSDGATRRACEDWAERLTTARAAIEAAIDFSDEGDVGEATVIAEAHTVATELTAAIGAALEDGQRAERLRDGFTVALIGRPNAGKSSLLNALVGREAAIVSPHPGTTRDVIEAMLEIEGWPIRLLDLAGLRDSADAVEQEGVRRARVAAEAADLRLVLVDGGAPERRTEIDSAIDSPGDSGALLLWTKADAPGFSPPPAGALAISAQSGQGLDALSAEIARRAESGMAAGDGASFARERERAAAKAALDALGDVAAAPVPELAAEGLRRASDALGRVTGRVDVEAVLDQVFGRFCIGK